MHQNKDNRRFLINFIFLNMTPEITELFQGANYEF